MTTEELLTTYPRATQVVREWFMKEMLKSFEDEEVPEDFKEAMRITGVPNGQLHKLIDAQPRILFDVFDENEIFIGIHVAQKECYQYTILGTLVSGGVWPTRKIAEQKVIEEAFRYLEEKLTPVLLESPLVTEEEENEGTISEV